MQQSQYTINQLFCIPFYVNANRSDARIQLYEGLILLKDKIEEGHPNRKVASLAIIDSTRDFNFQRKKRYMQVEKYILFGSPNDGLITPWQSTFFVYSMRILMQMCFYIRKGKNTYMIVSGLVGQS